MRTMAMFTSSLEPLRAWRAERLLLARFGPLALMLAWAACGSALASARGVAAAALAFSLVAQCRLWDDLADRGRDLRSHPERVLVRARSLAPFLYATVLLGGANALALCAFNGPAHALGAAALFAAIAGWYRWHARRELAHALMLLLKYPAFVPLLAAPGTWPLAAAAVVYGALCAFEWLDTRAKPTALAPHPGRYLPFACAALALLVMTLGEHA